MKTIEIVQTKLATGFTARPTSHTLPGVVFGNGKIAYLSDDQVCAAQDEGDLVKTLKASPGCLSVNVVHKGKSR